MARFGDELREAREARAVSLDEISKRTKVSVRHLAALEAEDYGAMPGGVFLKGMFRSYLSELQLVEREWMPRFEASLHRQGLDTSPDDTKLAEFAQAVKRSRSTEMPQGRARWLGAMLMVVTLLVAGFLAWKYVVKPRLSPPVEPPGLPMVPVSPPTEPAGTPAPTHSLLRRWVPGILARHL